MLVRLEGRLRRTHTLGEQRHGVLVGERRNRVFPLGGQVERSAAGHEDLQHRRVPEKLPDLGNSFEQLLEVVEEEQRLPLRQVLFECLLVRDPQGLRDRRKHGLGIAERGQRHEPDAVPELLPELGRSLKRKPRLPRAARPAERDEWVRTNERQHLVELLLSADQRRRLGRKVCLLQAFERPELAGTELVDPFGGREIFEAVLTEVS